MNANSCSLCFYNICQKIENTSQRKLRDQNACVNKRADLHDALLAATLVHPQVVVDGGGDLAAGDVQLYGVSAHHQVAPEHCGGRGVRRRGQGVFRGQDVTCG